MGMLNVSAKSVNNNSNIDNRPASLPLTFIVNLSESFTSHVAHDGDDLLNATFSENPPERGTKT